MMNRLPLASKKTAFPGERLHSAVVPSGERVVQMVLDRVRWDRPRDVGEMFLARHLWRLLDLEELLEERMGRGVEEIP
jgi:hypothetical protein